MCSCPKLEPIFLQNHMSWSVLCLIAWGEIWLVVWWNCWTSLYLSFNNELLLFSVLQCKHKNGTHIIWLVIFCLRAYLLRVIPETHCAHEIWHAPSYYIKMLISCFEVFLLLSGAYRYMVSEHTCSHTTSVLSYNLTSSCKKTNMPQVKQALHNVLSNKAT